MKYKILFYIFLFRHHHPASLNIFERSSTLLLQSPGVYGYPLDYYLVPSHTPIIITLLVQATHAPPLS